MGKCTDLSQTTVSGKRDLPLVLIDLKCPSIEKRMTRSHRTKYWLLSKAQSYTVTTTDFVERDDITFPTHR
jgi:hypothetical protein